MQRVQVLRSGKWKFLKNKPGGGGRKSSAKKTTQKTTRKTTKGSNPGGGSTGSSNRRAKIGASYQAFRTGAAALSPATDKGLRALQGGGATLESSGQQLIDVVRARPDELIAHEIVVGADLALDKKVGHAAAISRGSATAIVPELYTAYKSWVESAGESNPAARVRFMHRKAIATQFGYDATANRQTFADPDLRIYRLAKHGGQGLRWARGRIPFVKRMTEPVQKFFAMLGGTI